MIRTITLLVVSLLALPIVSYYFDEPLTDPQWEVVRVMLKMLLLTAVFCFVASELTRNYSQVDKARTLIAVVYVWYVAWVSQWDPRIVLMAILTTVWSARLTYNLIRRGGFSWIPWRGQEDYRWTILRERTPAFSNRWVWGAFNLVFIALYRNGLVFLFISPIIVAWQSDGAPLTGLDMLAAALFLVFVGVQAEADNQQYDFQTEKSRLLRANESLENEYADGFARRGLWRFARHPNYTAEQIIWISFYLFSVAATGRWVNWSLVGALLLILLFIGSADFTEKLSAEKYPSYARYQREVPRFIPSWRWLRKGGALRSS